MEAFADSFLPLTNDLEFDADSKRVFDQLNPMLRRKFMFLSPLPNQQYRQMPVSRSNSSSKIVGVDSPSYIIDGVKIQINTIHYFSALKFDVMFSEDSYIHETNFIDEFINRNLPQLFQTLPNQDLSRGFQELSGSKVAKKFDIEGNLERCVYIPIRPLVQENLNENRQALTQNTMDFLVAKGAFSLSSDRAPALVFDAIFKGGEGIQAMGLRAEPDLVIGYTLTSPSFDNVVFLTGVGEVKLPTMDLNPSSHSGRVNSNFAETVRKLTTVAVHCGLRRYLLTNYQQVLIVELDESFEELEVTSDLTFIRSRHHYFESTHNFIRLFIYSFFAITKEEIPRLELFKINVARTLNTEIQRLLSEQRLRNFNMSPPGSGSSTQSSASRSREQQQYSRSSLGGSLGANPSTNISRNDPSTIWSSRPSTNQRYRSRKLVIDPSLFVALQAVDVGKCIVKLLQLGQFFQAQVMTVNSGFFLSHFSADNKFCFSDNSLPAVSVLKIYDPFLEMVKDDGYSEVRDSTYQDSLDSIVNELICYRRLEEVQGDLVAEVFAYGNLQDVHESMFYAYFNFQGPFLLLESFDDVKDNTIKASDIDLDFIVNSIVPQFKRLHQYNVIQNDFRFSNIIITRSKEVKIIDFSNSKISYDQQEFDEEIENIYRYFGETPLH